VALFHSGEHGVAELLSEPVEVLTIPPSAFSGAFDRLGAFVAAHPNTRCAGWLGYDLRDDVETLPRRTVDDLDLPVLHVAAYGRRQRWRVSGAVPPPPGAVPRARELRAHLSRAEYERRVAAVVEHIHAGDIFQANLTQPFSGRFDGATRALFWNSCHRSPAPFSVYVEDGAGTAVVSASPEEFLHVEGRAVRTRPIKGTRPRAVDPAMDRALLQELLESPKDRAELAMIVDLLRNDLGRVAEVGSVHVDAAGFPEHHSFAQVHHLFATVEARLRADCGLVDLLRATFPGGSITGAPKLRCMEILEELEDVRRGVYTGAIGWFGPGDAAHLNVAIRTMVVRDGVVRLHVGGGVTAESDPAREFDETLHKALGMVQALGAEIVS